MILIYRVAVEVRVLADGSEREIDHMEKEISKSPPGFILVQDLYFLHVIDDKKKKETKTTHPRKTFTHLD